MTLKTLSGSYSHTYTLSASFTGVSITKSGNIVILGETAGVNGAVGLLMPNAGTLLNGGYVYGGFGGIGDKATTYVGATGGIGASVTGAGQITNTKIIQGGEGGQGATYATFNGHGYASSRGGVGGAGLVAGVYSYVNNSGVLRGGLGGQGGNGLLLHPDFGGTYECPGGMGWYGGAGLVLEAGAAVNNIGTIIGGRGGAGGTAPKIVKYGNTYTSYGGSGGGGGMGVESYGGGTVINYASIIGGGAGPAGTPVGGLYGGPGRIGLGVYMANGGTVINGSYDDPGAVITGNEGVGFGYKSSGTLINYGVISNSAYGGGGEAVVFGGKYALLVDEPGSKIIGSADGGDGGVLEMAGPRVGVETGTISWNTTGFGETITTGGSSTYFDRFGTLVIDGSCVFTVSGYAPINHGYGIVLHGSLGGAGTMSVVGTLGPNPGAFVDVYGGTLSMGSLIDSGSIGGYGTVNGAIYLDGGTLFANHAKTLTLQGANFTAINGGTFAASAGAVLQLPNNQSLATLTNTAVLEGLGSEIQWYNTVGHAQVTLDQALVSITATGSLDVSGGRNFVAANPIVDSGAIVLGNTIFGAGTISGGVLTVASGGSIDGFGEVAGGLSVLAGGVVDANAVSLVLAPNTHSIVNQGTLEAAAGGELTITNAAVTNTVGTVTANPGGIALASSSIYGGTVSIAAGGSLYAGVGSSTLAMAGGTVTNAGLIHTAAGGALTFAHAHVSNAGGTMVAGYNYYGPSSMTLYDSGVYGGAFTIASGCTLNAMGATNTISLAGATITNNGVIQTTTGGALTFTSEAVANGVGHILVGSGPGHVLLNNCIVEGGAITVAASGAIDAHYSGNTLAMAGGTITNAGTIDTLHGANLTLSNATVNNAGGVLLSQGYGGLVTLTNTTVLGAGTLATQASGGPACEIIIGNSSSVQVQGIVSNAGTIALQSSSASTDLRILAGGATLSGGGTVSMGGTKSIIIGATAASALTNVDNTIVGQGVIGANSMSLINQSKGVIDAVGAFGLAIATKGETLVNAGLMEATGGGILAITNTTIANAGGTLMATNVSPVKLQNAVVQGGSIIATGSGVVKFNVAGGELDGTTSAVGLSGVAFIVNGSNETLVGSIANAGKINLIASTSTCDLIIGAAGATLSGGGQVNMTNSLSNRIYGLASGDTLTNVDNRIDGAGVLGNGVMTLVNAAKGQIVGNQNFSFIIDTGTNTITNAGLIENVGKGGTLVKSAVSNTGTLLAATAGTLNLAGAVTGAGVGQINGGTLYVQQAYAEKVTFTGTTGVLELGASQAFTGTVAGLSKTGTDWLDLVDIGFFAAKTKATYSGTTASGTLTVTDGTHTAHISLIGNYIGSTWTASADGHGGTKVVDPPAGGAASASAASLTQALAGFQPGTAAHPGAPPAWSTPRLPVLHVQA